MARHRHRKNHKPQQVMTRNEKLATRQQIEKQSGQVPDCYRVIVELTCMMNNDEIFFYTKKKITTDDLSTYIHTSRFMDKPHVALCRPVYQQEIDAGLDISKRGEMYRSEFPDITLLLDAYYVLKGQADLWFREIPKKVGKPLGTPSDFLAIHIGSSAYDCMSGGMPLWEGYICYYLCQHPAIDLDALVYPGKDRSKGGEDGEPNKDSWYTLRDWLSHERNVPDFKAVLGDLKLPAMFETKQLPERTDP